MSNWPDYVSYAFGQLGYENYEDGTEPFVNRWGGLDVETFVRVLKTAKSAESGELFLGLPNFEQSRLTV